MITLAYFKETRDLESLFPDLCRSSLDDIERCNYQNDTAPKSMRCSLNSTNLTFDLDLFMKNLHETTPLKYIFF